MPKRIAPLTDAQIRNSKPSKKPRKMFDGGGLSFGPYPEISQTVARGKKNDARALVANGVDPSEILKAQQLADMLETETFEVITREWHSKFSLPG